MQNSYASRYSIFTLPFCKAAYEPCIIMRGPTFTVIVYDKLFNGKRGTRGANRVNFVSCNIPPHIAAIRYVFPVRHFPYSLLSFTVSSAFSAYHRSPRMQKISERQKPRAAQWLRGVNFGALYSAKAESCLQWFIGFLLPNYSPLVSLSISRTRAESLSASLS